MREDLMIGETEESSPTIELPSREEMRRRLMNVSSDPVLEERFYPRLWQYYAGKHMLPVGLAALFTRAIHDFNALNDAEQAVLYCNVDDCVDAIVSDAKVARAVKAKIRLMFPIPDFEKQSV